MARIILTTAYSGGGIKYDSLMADALVHDTTVHRVALLLTSFVTTFHMPAFFCISGVIFAMEVKKGKYDSLRKCATVKAKRLLLPMLFVWIAYNIPTKFMVGYFSDQADPVASAFLQILFPANVYLWFLEVLFILFMMDYLLTTRVHSIQWQCAICVALNLIGTIGDQYFKLYIPFGNPLRYYIWFWLGHHIDSITAYLRKTAGRFLSMRELLVLIETGMLLAMFILLRKAPSVWFGVVQTSVCAFVGILWVWEIASMIESRILKSPKADEIRRIVDLASGYTYGIYLYADPLNYVILYAVYSIFGIQVFGSETAALLMYLLRIFGTVAVACVITYLLRLLHFPIKAY